ncbi:peptidylprolyl isomerase [Martelella mediterranea]|uniref:Parvulin-like PPIase n=1 Tax=Martelella mediterranea TaxID=293089 RepID=A0A4R3NWB6_9HYPH|nr:peptidylprolyl isomerase [Martelella mediterranea]TCT44879.1 peptidyl-prolyl cis-trans isomerase C [Martelella mediterranea]
MHKRQFAAAAFLATVVGFSAPAFAQDTDASQTVVATVAGEPVYQSELNETVDQFKGQFGQLSEEQLKAVALSSLIDMKLIVADAEAKGLDETDTFKKRMDQAREQELYNAYFDEEIGNKITDDMLQARYDEEIAKAPKQDEVHARHILVDTKEEAEDIIKQLDDGADFAELAKEHSTGPSGEKGGDLGYFGKGQMVPEFEEVAFALEPGQHTEEPVKTQFGFHVIEVEDKREKAPVPFDQIKDQLRQLIISEKYNEVLGNMKDGDTVVIEDEGLQDAYQAINKQQQ